MAGRAAHLLDNLFPDVPVRQWVLSLPYRLRYQLAWNHDVCREVVAVFVRAEPPSRGLAIVHVQFGTRTPQSHGSLQLLPFQRSPI